MEPPKITLYEHKDFRGRSKQFTQNISNLVDVGFNDFTSSVIVEGGVWILYEHANYGGNIYVVMQGEKVNICDYGWNDKASSLKLLNNHDFTEVPRCIIYQHGGFGGRSLELTDDARNLKWYDFNDSVSSIRVPSGAWIGYQHADYKGSQSLFLRGDHNGSASEGGFRNDSLSSFRKIYIVPSGPVSIVKIDFDLSRGILNSKPTSVFQWTQRNDSSVEQSLDLTQEKSITTENTYEFHWDQGTKVSASYEVSIGLPEIGLGTKMTIGVEASYNVGSSSGKKTSKTEKWIVDFPSKIPARSQIILSSTVNEGKMDVPYTAVLRQGSRTWTEHGRWTGVQYYGFVTEFKEVPL